MDPTLQQLKAAAIAEREEGAPVVERECANDTHLVQTTRYLVRSGDGQETLGSQLVVEDFVQGQEYHKLTTYLLEQTGCCGALVSFDPHVNYPQPAGKCVSCGAYLCRTHAQEEYQCAICFAVLCRSCRRVLFHARGIVLCVEHFAEMKDDVKSEEFGEWLTNRDQGRHRTGFIES